MLTTLAACDRRVQFVPSACDEISGLEWMKMAGYAINNYNGDGYDAPYYGNTGDQFECSVP